MEAIFWKAIQKSYLINYRIKTCNFTLIAPTFKKSTQTMKIILYSFYEQYLITQFIHSIVL